MIIMLTEETSNGMVFNAKGDLVAGGITAGSQGGETDAYIYFYADGSVDYFAYDWGPTGFPKPWVETGPTPPAWIGAANYSMYWTFTTLPSTYAGFPTSNKTFENRIPMSSTITFYVNETSQGDELLVGTAFIYNESTFDTVSWAIDLVAS